MNKRLTALLLSMMIMASACSNNNTTSKDSTNGEKQEYLKKIEYTNLADLESQKLVEQLMQNAGIAKEHQKKFIEDVQFFNNSIKKEHLTNGFEITDIKDLKYDVPAMQSEWEKANSSLPGHNCRITTFGFMDDIVDVDKNAPKNEEWIMTDLVSISDSPELKWSNDQLDQYKVLFSTIPTEKTKDINVHVKKVQDDWKKRNIHFKKDKKVSMISVFFHDDLDEQDNLFIGHVGILIEKSKNELYFIEKLAFLEPYQMIKFNNRTELNDYLMSKYDQEWGQTVAKPFIMENDHLLEGYRPNPNNKADSHTEN